MTKPIPLKQRKRRGNGRIRSFLLGAALASCVCVGATYTMQPTNTPPSDERCYMLSADKAEVMKRFALVILDGGYDPALIPPPKKPAF
jgi:hypothetical protein